MLNNLFRKWTSSQSLFLMAGPCVIESAECIDEIAKKMTDLTGRLGINYAFKASFDKANRTSLNAFRGPGMNEGLKMLAEIKKKYKVPIVTDIHLPEQAERVAEVADIIQIPAFLSRQTDLVVAAAKTGKTVNLKKAQFMSPIDMKNVVNKAEKSGNENLFVCERGSCFGYNRLIVDMSGLAEMKKFGYPVVYDATHSVQLPGGEGTGTGGNREYIPYLSRAAAAVGVDGFFMEVHPEPEKALSDSANSIPLAEVEDLLKQLIAIHNLVRGF